MVKDAHGLLREWVPYHLLLGVAHIYIVNNDCGAAAELYSSCDILGNYIAMGAVTLIDDTFTCRRVSRANLLGALATELAHGQGVTEGDWILGVDPDEFMVLPPRQRVPQFFAELIGRQPLRVDSIPLPWRTFGSSFRHNTTRHGSLISNYRFRLPLALTMETQVRLVDAQKAKDQIHPFLFKELVCLAALRDPARCRDPYGAHGHDCTHVYDWVAQNVTSRSAGPGAVVGSMGLDDQSPMPAAVAGAFIHHYTFLSDEDWERKKLRGRPRRGTKFARRQGDIDELFSAVYDPTILKRVQDLHGTSSTWAAHPLLAQRCCAALQVADDHYETGLVFKKAFQVQLDAHERASRIDSEAAAASLLERWAGSGHGSRAPVEAAKALGATADEASLSSTAATWLLRRWNATRPSERRTAASIIADVVGAWPDACEDSGVLRPSNCAGWTQIWEERV